MDHFKTRAAKRAKRLAAKTAKDGIIYYGTGERPEGWVLAHNDVLRAADTRHGERGFRRFWLQPDMEGFTLCKCGWRPDLGPHYSRRPDIPVLCPDEDTLEDDDALKELAARMRQQLDERRG